MKLHDMVRERYGDADKFVAYLKGQMSLHGITQAKLSRRSGYPASVISRWLTPNDQVRVRPGFEARVILDEALDALVEGV